MQLESFLRLLLVVGFFSGVGCRKSTIDLPQETRNPRTFDWARDTLGDGTYQCHMSGIWGSSLDNVYVVGHSSDRRTRKIWYFNGIQWSDITRIYEQAFPAMKGYNFRPDKVTGFSANDVWIVGDRDTSSSSLKVKEGFIIHKSPGGSWDGMAPYGGKTFSSVAGLSSSDLWVGGWNGQLFHFDGTSWTEYSLNDSVMVACIVPIASDKVFASAWSFPDGVEHVRYYEWNGVRWSLVESRLGKHNIPEPGISIDAINGELFTATISYISRRVTNGTWQSFHHDPNARLTWVFSGGGNAFASGFMVDHSEALYHHDGQSWVRITRLNSRDCEIWNGWSSSDATFLISAQTGNTQTPFPLLTIIRGK